MQRFLCKQIVIGKRGKLVAKLVPLDEHPESFIGSMQWAPWTFADIVSPIDTKWEADSD